MKKMLAILLLCTFCMVKVHADSGKAIVNCTVYGNRGSGLFLYQLKDGEALSLGFKRPDEKGTLKFSVDVKEGIYFFRKAGVKGSDFNHIIYLKAGDQKKVDFYAGSLSIDYDSCVVEKPNTETKCLAAWLVAFNDYCKSVRSKTGQSHIKYKDFEKFAVVFLEKNKTSNTYFNQWLADKVNTDLKYLMAANYFNFTRGVNGKYDSAAVVQDFYKPLHDKQLLNNPGLLRSEHGLEMASYVLAYGQFNKVKNTADLIATPLLSYAPQISNDKVKVAFLAFYMDKINKYEDFVKYVQPYKSLFTSEEMKAAYQKRYEDLYLFAKGSPGYNFELTDANDKVHRFSDFKGKVVVVDIWAMWCAPCLAEKPLMTKIEETYYHGRNDIVFIGISVDQASRREIWKNFVKRQGWTNLELLADAEKKIEQYYRVEGIPRFLIFDREGKIVTVDAPRPSNPGFKKLIDQTLALAN